MGSVRALALHNVPHSVIRDDGSPRFGSYVGIPDDLDLSGLDQPFSRDPVRSFLRHKRWMYYFATTDELIIVGAIVDAGPTGTCFLMVTDRETGDVIADASRPGGVRPLVSVNDRPVIGHRSRYAVPGTYVKISEQSGQLRIRASLQRFPHVPMVSDRWVELDLRLTTGTHPGITAVSELVGHKLMSTTAKNACLPTSGQLVLNAHGQKSAYDLSHGQGGFDYTNGFLPRHTSWRWAYGMGSTDTGRTIGLNLTSDFVGIGDRSQESIAWLDGIPSRLDPAARIDFGEDPMDEWRVSTIDGSVDLTFTPLGVHSEALNLGALRTTFIQPTGHFSGTIRLAGQRHQVDNMPGVVENQDVLW